MDFEQVFRGYIFDNQGEVAHITDVHTHPNDVIAELAGICIFSLTQDNRNEVSEIWIHNTKTLQILAGNDFIDLVTQYEFKNHKFRLLKDTHFPVREALRITVS